MESNKSELVFVGHGNAVTSLAFSADGKTLVSGSYDRTAIVWDVESSAMQRLLPCRDLVNGITITPDGRTVITDDGQVWEASTGRRLRMSRCCIAPLACSPDGRTLACATFTPNANTFSILLADVLTGRMRYRFVCGQNQPHSLAFSSDGEIVAVCAYDGYEGENHRYLTTTCNLQTGETRSQIGGRDVTLNGVHWGPGVRLVGVSGDWNQPWKLCNAETGEALTTGFAPGPDHMLLNRSISLSPDGRLLAFGTDGGLVSVWNAATSECLWQVKAHRSWVRTMAFTHDGGTLATAGNDYAIRLWDAATGTPRATLGRPREPVEAVAFSPDAQAITTISEDNIVRLWRISPPACERLEVDAPGVLASGAPHKRDTARNLWNIDDSALPTAAELPGGFTIAAVSLDGSLAALNLPDGYISIWNRETKKLLQTMQKAQIWWGIPAFSPDNRYLVSGSENGLRVCVFDVRKSEISKELATDEETVEFAFSSDGRLLAVGHLGFAVSLWNLRSGRRRRRIRTDRDSISALAFSPDGGTLAIGTDYEETARLKRLTRGRKDIRLVGHTDNIRSIDFSPDGTRLVTGAQDGTARLWDPESGRLLATFLSLPEKEWVIYTPEGQFTGSPGAEKWMLWRNGAELAPVGDKHGEAIK